MLTKLEAVNEILDVIDEPAVESLFTGNEDAEEAERKLDEVSKETQAKGWECNTDEAYPFQPTTGKRIPIPDTVLRIEPVDEVLKISARRLDGVRHLYDRTTFTFDIDQAIKCDVVWFLDFDDLTYPLQKYIAALAARRFQESAMGSTSLDSFARRKEMEAYAALLDAESMEDDINSLRDNPYIRYITGRNNILSGR